MRNKIILSLCFLFLFIFSVDAQNEKISLPTFSFTIPNGMKHHPNDSDVLAKLSFENSLYITIDNNMEKMLELTKNAPKEKQELKWNKWLLT